MSDDAALLHAIADAPDDLQLRLVYADFCEEHGRASRAALIRGQCLLDGVLVALSPGSRHYDRRDSRWLDASDFGPDLREDLLGPMRPFAEAAGFAWDREDGFLSARSGLWKARRGFVESFSFPNVRIARTWLDHAAAMLARMPLLHLEFRRHQDYRGSRSDPRTLPHALLEGLLAVEGIGRLRELDLSDFRLDSAGARLILARGGALRPGTIHLRHNSLGRKTVAELEARFGSALKLDRGHWVSDDEIPF